MNDPALAEIAGLAPKAEGSTKFGSSSAKIWVTKTVSSMSSLPVFVIAMAVGLRPMEHSSRHVRVVVFTMDTVPSV